MVGFSCKFVALIDRCHIPVIRRPHVCFPLDESTLTAFEALISCYDHAPRFCDDRNGWICVKKSVAVMYHMRSTITIATYHRVTSQWVCHFSLVAQFWEAARFISDESPVKVKFDIEYVTHSLHYFETHSHWNNNAEVYASYSIHICHPIPWTYVCTSHSHVRELSFSQQQWNAKPIYSVYRIHGERSAAMAMRCKINGRICVWACVCCFNTSTGCFCWHSSAFCERTKLNHWIWRNSRTIHAMAYDM